MLYKIVEKFSKVDFLIYDKGRLLSENKLYNFIEKILKDIISLSVKYRFIMVNKTLGGYIMSLNLTLIVVLVICLFVFKSLINTTKNQVERTVNHLGNTVINFSATADDYSAGLRLDVNKNVRESHNIPNNVSIQSLLDELK